MFATSLLLPHFTIPYTLLRNTPEASWKSRPSNAKENVYTRHLLSISRTQPGGGEFKSEGTGMSDEAPLEPRGHPAKLPIHGKSLLDDKA